MKKMSPREMVMVVGLLIALLGYGFLTFVWDPMEAKKAELTTEMTKKEDELFRKNVEALEAQKRKLHNEKSEAGLKIEQIKQEKTFGVVNYQELIEYLGKEADSLQVDVVQFKKQDPQNTNAYWEIPYEVTVQGNYDNIIRFVNSFYELENYFLITGLDMREVARIPMTDKVADGNPELTEDIDFEWASEFIEKLDKSIPSELLKDSEEAFMEDFATEMDKLEEELSKEEKNVEISDKMQLKFMFHFVSLEEPTE